MPQLSDIHQLLTALPEKQRRSVAGLIDLKVEGDMDKVLHQLKQMETSLSARMDSMEAKMDSMEAKFDARIDNMESKFDAKIQMLFWAVGLMATILLALLSKLLFGS